MSCADREQGLEERTSSAEPPSGDVDLVVDAAVKDVGGLPVRRALPFRRRRSVGPFVFVDHMGPAVLAPGQGVDVRPHPHIGLSTLTYLFSGVVRHADSLGVVQDIRPGEVNWMTAGRGITHSERTPPEARRAGGPVHGMQVWVALPAEQEEREPAFVHVEQQDVPVVDQGPVRLRLAAGSIPGTCAPVPVHSPLFFLEAVLPPGSRFELPVEPDHEAAVYVAEGEVHVAGADHGPGRLVVSRVGKLPPVTATAAARVVVFGGQPFPEPRHIFWNFVSSRRDRIDAAKQQWLDRAFPVIPGDDEEYIPLP